MTEKDTQTRILKTFGAHPDIRLWRVNVGLAYGYGQISGLLAVVNRLVTYVAHGARVQGIAQSDKVTGLIGKLHPTRYGIEGMSDIQGIGTYMNKEGRPWARFLGIEVKAPGKKPTPEQVSWGGMVESRGGIWILAYSEEDVTIRLKHEGFDV